MVFKEPCCLVGPQASVKPLKDYSARKFISLQSGSLSAGPFRPASCYKANLIVMEATTVNKQKRYNMFLFQCHWFNASLCLLENNIAAASLIHYCRETEMQLLHLVSQPAGCARLCEHLCVLLLQWLTCSCHRAQMMSHMSAMWAITFQRTTPVSPITSPGRVGPVAASGCSTHPYIHLYSHVNRSGQIGDPLHTPTNLLVFINAANDS